MKNIIDLYSRQQFGKLNQQNHKENDALTTDYGHYLGVLKRSDTTSFRNLIDHLQFLSSQIEGLSKLWDFKKEEVSELTSYYLSYLNINNKLKQRINLDKDQVMVSEDGHVWVIFQEELDLQSKENFKEIEQKISKVIELKEHIENVSKNPKLL